VTDWSDLRVVGGGPGGGAALIVSGVGGRERGEDRDKGTVWMEERRGNRWR